MNDVNDGCSDRSSQRRMRMFGDDSFIYGTSPESAVSFLQLLFDFMKRIFNFLFNYNFLWPCVFFITIPLLFLLTIEEWMDIFEDCFYLK